MEPDEKIHYLLNNNYTTDMKIVLIFDLLNSVQLNKHQKKMINQKIGFILTKNNDR
jgi:hypothetical protein